MTSQVTQFFYSLNTPYVASPEKDIYDLSAGASYTFLTDFTAWGKALTISLFFITKVEPFLRLADPFPLSLSEAFIITVLGSSSAALTKRVVGFEKDPKSEAYIQNTYANHFAYAGFAAATLCVIPFLTLLSFERMISLVIRTLFPPLLFSYYTSISLSETAQKQAEKVQKIHKDYSSHHANIMQLGPDQQKSIFNEMYISKLEPPKEIRQRSIPFFNDFHPTKEIFVYSDPKDFEMSEWLKGKVNAFLQTVRLPTFPSLAEWEENMNNLRVQQLDSHQLQWIVLSLSSSSVLELKESDFNKLQEQAKAIKELDTTGLIEKLTTAPSIEDLKREV